ncbi:hypothetical protein [Tenacibaculum sp.]|uniref:hypothetical protein n=2 Tax=Tenacibaculum sp. TaxID=1906242 RepID=UPI003D0B454A
MIKIFLIIFALCSLILILSSRFRKQTLYSKVLIYLSFTIISVFIFFITIIYLWNSGDDYNQRKHVMESWNIQVLNNSEMPIKNVQVINLRKQADTIISDVDGTVNLYEYRENLVVFQAGGYIPDTINVVKMKSRKVYLNELK